MALNKPNPAAAAKPGLTKPLVKPPANKPPVPSAAPVRAKARTRTFADGDFDYDGDTASTGGGLSGFYQPGVSVQVVKPQWKGTTPMVFRLLPAIDPEDCSTLLPGRKSAQPGHFSQWVYLAEAANYVGIGDNKQSFLLFDSRWGRERNYDRNSNPYYLLSNQVRRALDKGAAQLGPKSLNISSWMPLTKFSQTDRAKGGLSVPTQMAFMRVFVYQNAEYDRDTETQVPTVYVRGNKPPLGASPGDRLAILELKRTAFRAQFRDPESPPDLYSELHQVRTTEPVEDELDALLWPDPTSLEAGPFITVYRPKKHSLEPIGSSVAVVEDTVEYDETPDVEDDDAPRGRRGGKKKGGFESWGVKASDRFIYVGNDGKKKSATRDISSYADNYRSQYLWFEDIFVIPTHEEICEKLARCFKALPQMLEFAWRDYPEYWQAKGVQNILRAQTISLPSPGSEDIGEPELVGDDDDVVVPPQRQTVKKQAPGDKQRTAKALAALAVGLSEEMLDGDEELPDESDLAVDQYAETGADDGEQDADSAESLEDLTAEFEDAAEAVDDEAGQVETDEDQFDDADVPFDTDTADVDVADESDDADDLEQRQVELEKKIAELAALKRAAQRSGSAGVVKAGAAQQEADMAKKKAAAKAPQGKPAKKAAGKPAKK